MRYTPTSSSTKNKATNCQQVLRACAGDPFQAQAAGFLNGGASRSATASGFVLDPNVALRGLWVAGTCALCALAVQRIYLLSTSKGRTSTLTHIHTYRNRVYTYQTLPQHSPRRLRRMAHAQRKQLPAADLRHQRRTARGMRGGRHAMKGPEDSP